MTDEQGQQVIPGRTKRQRTPWFVVGTVVGIGACFLFWPKPSLLDPLEVPLDEYQQKYLQYFAQDTLLFGTLGFMGGLVVDVISMALHGERMQFSLRKLLTFCTVIALVLGLWRLWQTIISILMR